MSKISQKNKELKAKKISKKAVKQTTDEKNPTKSSESKMPNYGKCCTCRAFRTNPGYCTEKKAYCARKAEQPCWKGK